MHSLAEDLRRNKINSCQLFSDGIHTFLMYGCRLKVFLNKPYSNFRIKMNTTALTKRNSIKAAERK